MKRDWTPDEKANQGDVSPVEWWGNHRKYYPALFDIARRVFTIPTSAAAAKKSWSTHKYINSLLRDRVKHETLCKLVFIYANRNASDAVPEMIYNIESAPNQVDDDNTARNDAARASDRGRSGDEGIALLNQDNTLNYSIFESREASYHLY